MSKTKDKVIADMNCRQQPNSDDALTLLMADIDKALIANHATKPMLIGAANQMLVSVMAEIAEEKPDTDIMTLLESTFDAIREHVRHRVFYGARPSEMGEA